MDAWNSGTKQLAERTERSRLDVILDKLNDVYGEVLEAVEGGGLEQLDAAEKISWWQRFETFRNRLPLIDHSLIADAEASDLAKTYCCSTLTQFLMRTFQLSHGEAASRVRAAAAVGPRMSMLGEPLEPLLPQLAAVQRDGAVTAEKVQIVERAMHKLSRAGLHPDDVETAERLLSDYAPVLGPKELHRYALQVIDAADPDGPEPVDDQLQQDRRHLELKQRRDGMWSLQGRLTNTVGAQLNAILDPLAKHRTSSIEDEDGNTIQIPDARPSGQRLHDALDEACGRLLKSADQPLVGGVPASVIITVQLARSARQSRTRRNQRRHHVDCRAVAADRRRSRNLAHHHQPQQRPLSVRTKPTARLPRPNHGLDRPRRRMLIPRLHPPAQLVRPAPHQRLD